MVYFKKNKFSLISASVVLLYTSYKIILLALDTKKKKGSKEIPVPDSAYPFVGHMLSLGEFPGLKIKAWHERYGPLIKLFMGAQTWIMVADAELAHKILATNSAKTSFRPKLYFSHHLYSMGGKGIAFAQPGERWNYTRSKVYAGLSPKQINSYLGSIMFEAQEMVNSLLESSNKEDGIMPFNHLKWYAMNTILSLCFGKRFSAVDDPEFVVISDLAKLITTHLAPENDLANFLPLFSFFDYFTNKRATLKKIMETERNPIYLKIIKDGLSSDKPNIVKTFKEGNAYWTDDEYIGFISDMIAGGVDTVAVSLMWNITLLCNYPNYQKTASDEIDAFIILNGRLPDFTERTQLPYLISAIKESLRLNPSSQFGLPHTIEEELEIDGYIFPKGCSIISSMHALHSNSRYEQPKSFIPERFMKNDKTIYALQNGKLEERDQFNFGWGRRVCPATYLAEAEIFTVLVHILSQCSINPPPEGIPDIHKGINTGLNILPLPCKLSFIRRSDSLI